MVGFSSVEISTSTGLAPQWMTAAAVATNVSAGTRTSSPGPMPSPFRVRKSAAVPLQTATASVVPVKLANAFSKASVRGPEVIHSESIVLNTSASSRSLNSSSDSRAFHIGSEKDMLHVWEVFVGALVIVRPADVQPIRIAFISQHAFFVFEKLADEIRKIEFLRTRDKVAHFRREYVDSHADEIVEIRLFVVLRDLTVGRRLDYA